MARYRFTCVLAIAFLSGAVGLTAGVALASGQDITQGMGCYCVDSVGNVNCDYADKVTISDLTLLIDHLFISGVRLPNMEEANADGDPAGVIDIGDVAMLIDHLFINKVVLPSCPQPHNTPPETRIIGLINLVPFINDIGPGVPTTGVFLGWSGEDLIDHPYDSPEFDFEYRLYGPYSDSLFDLVRGSFVVPVFRTTAGDLIGYGLPPDISCDTSWDGGVRAIDCDTVLIDTLGNPTTFGRPDTLFHIYDPDFVGNPDFNRICLASSDGGDAWTTRTSDTLYNVFSGYQADTTRLMNFIFWVRARDPIDPNLFDPTPALGELAVIDAKFERDVLIVNWSSTAHENRADMDSTLLSWDRAIESWTIASGLESEVDFDTARDFGRSTDMFLQSGVLGLALKYKVLVIIQDAAVSGGWSAQGTLVPPIFAALATGANAWVAARVPLGLHQFGALPQTDIASADYTFFFGVEQTVYSGWAQGFYTPDSNFGFGLPRIEDFIGAYSENTARWPDLSIDTAFLHTRYDWQGSIEPPVFPYYPFLPEIGALPEVGWAQPSQNAEIMYRYQSLYGETHPITPELSFEGLPVMHRLEHDRFRTVHAMFTPLALEETSAQLMINSVLTWLYDRPPPEPTPEARSGGRPATTSSEELRNWYLNWRQKYAGGNDEEQGPSEVRR
jgi:hypothetical protein